MPSAFATKLLFVCSRNRKRSLTAEQVFGGRPGFEVRSAGTQPEARIVVTAGHIGWADIVFVMERSHANRLRAKLGDALEGKRVIVLNIPDDFEYMQAELIEALEATVGEHLDLPLRTE